jgi:hypothetical protein
MNRERVREAGLGAAGAALTERVWAASTGAEPL